MDSHYRLLKGSITRMALLFELGLAAVAVAISWLIHHHPWGPLTLNSRTDWMWQLVAGSLAALPLFGTLVLVDRLPTGFGRQLRLIVHEQVVPLFQNTTVWGLLAISAAAGLGEELLFRGLIQAKLIDWLGPGWGIGGGLLIASALFGLCHWLSASYALLAGIMGLLLGCLFLATGSLVAPITMHAVYDFLALLYLVHWHPQPPIEHQPG